MELIVNHDLIRPDGTPVYGYHKSPIKNLNISDFKPAGSRGLKRWVFLGISHADIIFGMAVVNLGYLSNLFCYVFDRAEKKLVEFDFKRPFGKAASFSGNGSKGAVSYRDNNAKADIMLGKDNLKLFLDVKGKLQAKLDFTRLAQSLNLVTQIKPAGFNYTLKEAGLEAGGEIKCGQKEYTISPEIPSGVFDYTYGILKRNTSWKWASGSGMAGNKKIGFNFSKGINDAGFDENVFWVDGKMVKAYGVDFEFDEKKPLEPWKIKSADGKVDLVFTPEGERAMNFNIGLIKSFYHQPFGSFSGKLSDGENVYKPDKVYGVTEDHEAVW